MIRYKSNTNKAVEMQDTPEQSAIINFKGSKLVVVALAGTGKTSVLVRYAEEHPKERMLYMAYNRAIRDEAVSKFPANVVCKTSHQLAFRHFGRPLQHKLVGNLRLTTIKQTGVSWDDAGIIREALNSFMYSAESRISPLMFLGEGETLEDISPGLKAEAERLAGYCNALWQRMIDPSDRFPAVHDTYLKLFQLSKPITKNFDTLLFDEAQDANPATSDIVLSQACKIILVGDPNQQIYRFRGADNAMEYNSLKDATKLYLTKSFRVGNNVSALAGKLLQAKGMKKQFIGNGSEDRVGRADLMQHVTPKTVIHRTVAAIIQTAYCHQHKPIYWVGGIESYSLDNVLDVYWLSAGLRERVVNKKLLVLYSSFEEYKEVAKESGDIEMARAVRLIKSYKHLPEIIAALKLNAVEEESQAAITVTTAHRCKGLEWDNVEIAGDFQDLLDEEVELASRLDEANLLYVAITRAKKQLLLSQEVKVMLHSPNLPAALWGAGCKVDYIA